MRKLKSMVAAGALAVAAIASPAAAWVQVPWTGSPTGGVWGAPWTGAQNSIGASPLRWAPTHAGVGFTVFFEGRTDSYAGPRAPGLAAALTLELDSVMNNGKTWKFDYEIWNASNDVGANVISSSRVSSFSFDVDPDENSAALVQGAGWAPVLLRDVKMQAGATTLNNSYQDICVKVGNDNNCHGNHASWGIAPGLVGSGSLTLTYLTAPNRLVFTDPMVRFQAVNIQGGANGASGTGIPVAWVPEPATWAMMIMGFGGVGALLRRRRSISLAV